MEMFRPDSSRQTMKNVKIFIMSHIYELYLDDASEEAVCQVGINAFEFEGCCGFIISKELGNNGT